MVLRVLTLLAVLAGAACASAGPPAFANRFIRHGTPAIDLGGPRPAAPPPDARTPLSGTSLTSALTRVSSSAASLESADPGLQRSLAALLIAPTSSHHVAVAREYQRLGIMDQAYNYLTRALDRHGPDAVVYDERARLWRDWGHPGFGLTDAHHAVYLAPTSPAVHNTLGTLLYRLGRIDEAEAAFTEALALDPAAWYALANLCHLNLARGRTRDAINQCHQATALRDSRRAARPVLPGTRR